MAFIIFPIGDVSLNTIQGVSDYWVRLPVNAKPIRNITTQLWGSLALALAGGAKGVFLESLKVADSVVIDNCEDAWDSAVAANTTNAVDLVDFKVGTASVKHVCAAAMAADVFTTEVVAPGDLDTYTHIEVWLKSSVDMAADSLRILLDDTADCASVLETLSAPALVANVWKHCRIALANPQLDLAIISAGLQFHIDVGACNVWMDDLRAVTLARSVEVLKVDDFNPDDMYFALSAGIESDDCKTNRKLMVYYTSPDEDDQCSN
jgi:hypothetical protein